MKRMLLSILLLVGYPLIADEMNGVLTEVVVDGQSTSYYNSPYSIQSASYTNGGLTFTFAEGFFIETPYVFVSLIYPSDDNPGYTWTAYNRSLTGITIKVYDSTGTEVGNDDVEVDIFATSSDPNGESVLVSGSFAVLAAVPARTTNTTTNNGHGHGHQNNHGHNNK